MKLALGAPLAGLVLALASSAPARAAEPAATAYEPARRPSCGGDGPGVQITWVDIAAPEALERAVCDWFRDEPWRVRFAAAAALAPAPRGAEAELHLLVHIASSSQARLFVHAPGEPAWSYDVALPGPLDAASVEVLAQALHSTVQAATERRHASAPPRAAQSREPTATSPAPDAPGRRARVPVAEPALEPSPLAQDVPISAGARVDPAPRARSGSPLPVHTGVGYLALLRGDEPLIHGPTLRITVDAQRQGPTLGGYFRGTLFSSGARDTTGISVRSSGVSLGAGVSAAAPLAKTLDPLQARAALGAGVDLLALDVRVTDPARARLAADRRARPRPFVGAEAGVAWHTGPIELELTLLLRWQLLHTTYEVRDPDGQRSTVFEPWRLQPGASLAAAYVW